VLQSRDVQNPALCIHLFELQPASLGHAQPVPENQKQQATVAGLVAASPGRGNQLSNFKAGKVVASGLAPRRVFFFWLVFVVRASSSFCRELQTQNSAKTLINRNGGKLNPRQIGSKCRGFMVCGARWHQYGGE
jgi:hypothetical protein